jgi:hypothetical protein
VDVSQNIYFVSAAEELSRLTEDGELLEGFASKGDAFTTEQIAALDELLTASKGRFPLEVLHLGHRGVVLKVADELRLTIAALDPMDAMRMAAKWSQSPSWAGVGIEVEEIAGTLIALIQMCRASITSGKQLYIWRWG